MKVASHGAIFFLPAVALAGLLLCWTQATAQSSGCAEVARTGNEVIVSAHSWDPVLAMANTFADRYGIRVSVESPRWDFPGDAEDVAIADPQFSAQHRNVHYLVMKPHVLQLRFSAAADPPPEELLRRLVEAANKEMPYAYRLDVYSHEYAIVPTKTRNSAGEQEDVTPLLDRHVTIPAGTRTIAEHARLMADQLSEQTELNVGCCQVFVTGIPWGQAEVPFQAHDEPAREVLRRLIRLEQQQNSPYDHWTVSCDGTGAPWCFIEVRGVFTAHCR